MGIFVNKPVMTPVKSAETTGTVASAKSAETTGTVAFSGGGCSSGSSGGSFSAIA